MKTDPHVEACVMFGRSRFNAGVLIDPKPEFKFDPNDEARLSKFRSMIWYAFLGYCIDVLSDLTAIGLRSNA